MRYGADVAFQSKQVREALRIPQRTLANWVRDGVIEPSIMSAQGRGTTNVYSEADLFAIAICQTLANRMGFPNEVLATAFREIRDNYGKDPDALKDAHILEQIVYPEGVEVLDDETIRVPDSVEELTVKRQFILVFGGRKEADRVLRREKKKKNCDTDYHLSLYKMIAHGRDRLAKLGFALGPDAE